MIKILFFIPALSGGGAEKVLRNLVNNMDRSEFDITVHTIAEEQPEKYLVQGIHYKAINWCKNPLFRKIFQYWIRLCAELKVLYPLYIKDDYDIEVAYLECGATKIISSSTNKKALKLAWVHCDLEKKEGYSKNLRKSKKQYEKFDKVICVSKAVKTAYVHLFGNCPETVVLHNVVDEDEIIEKSKMPLETDRSKVKLAAVGRLTWQKGFDRLVQACAHLKKDGCRFELWILGEGPERSSLEQLIREHNLEHEIKLVGFLKNPYPYMAAADIIVCSSRYEGMSTAVTEALILGKAVISTPCTGMEELLGDSEYGYITKDSAEGIYQGIKQLIESESLREQYSEAAKARGKAFMKSEVLKETEQFFITNFGQKNKLQ